MFAFSGRISKIFYWKNALLKSGDFTKNIVILMKSHNLWPMIAVSKYFQNLCSLQKSAINELCIDRILVGLYRIPGVLKCITLLPVVLSMTVFTLESPFIIFHRLAEASSASSNMMGSLSLSTKYLL